MRANPTILIVDDEEIIRKLLTRVLQRRGYSTIVAGTGKDGMEKAVEEKPAVALIDLQLGDMSGVDVLREVRKHSPDTECILITGHATEESAIEAVNLGAYGYIQKPWDEGQLLMLIQRAIERRDTDKLLRESEKRFRSLFENSPDAVFVEDLDGTVLEVNSAACRLHGLTSDELIGKSVLELVPPDKREEVARDFPGLSQGEYGQVDGYSWTSDGYAVPVEIRAGPIDYAGKPAVLLQVRDITHRKKAEEALRRAHDELEIRVQERTAELVEANKNLQEEVAQRRRAEDKLKDRATRLALINEIGRQIVAELELDDLLGVVHQQISRLFDAGNFYVALYEERSRQWFLALSIEHGKRQSLMFRAVDVGLTGWIIRNREPVLLHSSQEYHAFHEAQGIEFLGERAVSWMGVPLLVRNKVVGVMGIQSYEQENLFNQEDLTLFSTIAAQVAIGFENQRLLKESRQRAQALATINEVGRAVTSVLGVDAVLRQIVDTTKAHFGQYFVGIALLEGSRLVFRDGSTVGDADIRLTPGQLIGTLDSTTSPIVEAARTGKPILVNDVLSEPCYVASPELPGTRSELELPIIVKGRFIGVLDVESDQSYAFDQSDVPLLQSLAHQAGIAVENARLYEQAQQEIFDRKRAEEALESERASLADRVAEQTAELRAANTELARASRLKDEFLANMSHEFRTPLNTILGVSEALQEQVYGEMNEKQLKSLCRIEESGRHLLALINDILDVSKIESGKVELEFGPVAVEALCQAALGLLKQGAHKKELQVSSQIGPAIRTIRADERGLKQILVNLLSNAVKFTPKGGSIGLEVEADTDQGAVHFTVWDTGIGISQEAMGRLFEPFVQLDSRLSRAYEGTGLGLSLVHRLTALHGGSVGLESEEGAGSRFTVSLPLERDEEEGIGERRIAVGERGRRGVVTVMSFGADNTCQAAIDFLEGEGYRVVDRSNVSGVMAYARKERPKGVVINIDVPHIDIAEAIRRMRAESDLDGIPLIIITSLSMPGDRERCLEAGADEYLSKPIRPQVLVDLLSAREEQS